MEVDVQEKLRRLVELITSAVRTQLQAMRQCLEQYHSKVGLTHVICMDQISVVGLETLSGAILFQGGPHTRYMHGSHLSFRPCLEQYHSKVGLTHTYDIYMDQISVVGLETVSGVI